MADESEQIPQKITHMEVYEKNLEKLVKALPMDDVTFTTELSSKKLLPASVDDRIKSLPTCSDKADYYLKIVIKSSLDIGETQELNNLITVMEKCGYPFVERLAEAMKSDLDKELKAKSPGSPAAKIKKPSDKCSEAIENITTNYAKLTRSFPTGGLLPELYSKEVITNEQKEDIQKEKLKKDKVSILFDGVIRPDLEIGITTKYDKLIEVMEASDDTTANHLARLLKGGSEKIGGSKRVPTDPKQSGSERVSADPKQSDPKEILPVPSQGDPKEILPVPSQECSKAIENITTNYSKLSKIFPIDDLLPELYSKKVIDGVQKESIEKKKLKKGKVSFFFDEIIKPELESGFITKYDNLIEVMEASDDRTAHHLAELLKEKSLSMAETAALISAKASESKEAKGKKSDSAHAKLPPKAGVKGAASISVFNNEKCPLKDCPIISRMFDYNGGELIIKEHAVKVTVPTGAIDRDYEAQIEVAASLLGPYMIPEDYYPISVYVWIGACYKFKKNLTIEMEHDIVVTEETDVSELCVLTACEEDKCGEENNQILKMHEDTCEFELKKSTCIISTSHFCSSCLAANKRQKVYKTKRIMMYHYLPEDYKSADEFVAEVCFCYDLQFCKEGTEKRYIDRRMKQELSFPIQIFDWKKDKILLSYPEKLENWEICHSGDDEIISEELNFRELGYSASDLLIEENNNRFPPRFRLKMVNKRYTSSEMNLLYKYYISVKSEGKTDKKLTLNISGFGNPLLNKAKRKHEMDEASDESESGVKPKKLMKEELTDPNEHHHKMTHMEVYEKYKDKLVNGLPMDDVTFTTQLSSHDLLPDNVDASIKSLPTQCEKADYFLKHVIKPSLDFNDTEELDNLIIVMKKCGYPHIKRLANKMKLDLKEE